MRRQRRARSDEQKQERKHEILNSAKELFQNGSFEKITMNHIAKNIGLTKGTVYLYFKTKEELFLTLFIQEFKEVFNELNRGFRNGKREWEIEEFAEFMVYSMSGKSFFLQLAGILHTVLEHNIDFDFALEFKQTLMQHLAQTGELLEEKLFFLQKGEGAKLLMRIHQWMIGCLHTSSPSETVQKLLDKPGMQVFQINFSEELSQEIVIFLHGMKVLAKDQ